MGADRGGKLLVAGLGALVLARELGLRRGPALVAAVVFMLSAPLLAWLQWPLTTVYSLLPWLLAATERLRALPSRRRVGRAGGLVVALSLFAGHPGDRAAVVERGRRLPDRARPAARRRAPRGGARARAWVGAHALGVLLAAACWCPS